MHYVFYQCFYLCFAVGADIREMNLLEFQDVLNSDFPSRLCEVSNCRKPIIAAVNGQAVNTSSPLLLLTFLHHSFHFYEIILDYAELKPLIKSG